MTKDLESTFGKEFAEEYEEQVQQRRREREEVDDKSLIAIADKAINQSAFKGDKEPHFMFTTDSGIDHDVLLMSLPDPDNEPIWNRVNKLDSGAVTCPLDYMGQWMSCLFNNPDHLRKLEPGDYGIIVGKMDTWEDEESEKVYDQVSPVRGVITLEEAEELAKKSLDDSDINESEQEEIPETTEDEDEDEEEEEDTSSSSIFSSSDDDEEEEEQSIDTPDYSDVANEVEELAVNDEQVWEIDEGDERLDVLAAVVASRLDLIRDRDDVDSLDDEILDSIRKDCLERIEEEVEGDKEEDDEEDQLF